MVTYCIGSARQKRAYFRDCELVLDNVEVLFCMSENGVNFFAVGDVPFKDFTVAEYLAYRRALCGGAPNAATIGSFGLAPDKRLGRLAPAEMRIVAFLEKTGGKTDKSVVINLDGAKYSRRNARALCRLLAAVDGAFVCITDLRFLRGAEKDAGILSFGKLADRRRAAHPSFFRAHVLAERIGAKRVETVKSSRANISAARQKHSRVNIRKKSTNMQ